MKLIVDANIILSSLISNGINRSLVFSPELILYSPHFLKTEVLKYKEYAFKKSKLSQEEFDKLLNLLFNQITFVNEEEYKFFMIPARQYSDDPKDWEYVALALQQNATIWSEDQGYKSSRIQVKTSQELIKMLK